MKSWELTALLVALLAVGYLACQGTAENGAAMGTETEATKADEEVEGSETADLGAERAAPGVSVSAADEGPETAPDTVMEPEMEPSRADEPEAAESGAERPEEVSPQDETPKAKKSATKAETSKAKKPAAEDETSKGQPSQAKKPGAEDETSKGEASKSSKGEVGFAENAFPPTVSDTDYHQGAWYKDDCLRCHETGVEDATKVKHKDMAPILLVAKCRSCHLLIPGQAPKKRKKTDEEKRFADFAFPPMIPASDSHKNAWLNDNCLLCHESGVRGAPVVKHKDMPKVLLKAKCRSCHVQVRSSAVSGR